MKLFRYFLYGLAIAVVAQIVLLFLIPQGPPTWDGAEHSLHGLRIAWALEHGDADRFIQSTTEQTLWPFLHSWILGGALSIFPKTFTTARTVSFAAFLLLLFLTAFLTRRLRSEEKAFPAASSAVILVLCSPMMILYSTQPMLEIFGALFTVAFMACFTLDFRSDHLKYVAAGIVLTAAFFTKYVYGQLLVTAVIPLIAADIFRGVRKGQIPWKTLTCKTVFLLGPLLAGMAFWFTRKPALNGFMACLDNPVTGLSVISPVNWIAYPIILILYYFPTPLLGVLGFIFLFRRQTQTDSRTSETRRLIIIYIIAAWITLTVYPYKLARAVFTLYPLMVVLISIHLGAYLKTAHRWKKTVMLLFFINIPLVLIPSAGIHLNPLLTREQDHMVNFHSKMDQELRQMAETINDTDSLCLAGDSHAVSPALLSWYLCLSTDEFPRWYPSLLKWDHILYQPVLTDLMRDRGFTRCLVSEIVPDSPLYNEDYQLNYKWMLENMIFPERANGRNDNPEMLWARTIEPGLVFYFWEVPK